VNVRNVRAAQTSLGLFALKLQAEMPLSLPSISFDSPEFMIIDCPDPNGRCVRRGKWMMAATRASGLGRWSREGPGTNRRCRRAAVMVDGRWRTKGHGTVRYGLTICCSPSRSLALAL